MTKERIPDRVEIPVGTTIPFLEDVETHAETHVETPIETLVETHIRNGVIMWNNIINCVVARKTLTEAR